MWMQPHGLSLVYHAPPLSPRGVSMDHGLSAFPRERTSSRFAPFGLRSGWLVCEYTQKRKRIKPWRLTPKYSSKCRRCDDPAAAARDCAGAGTDADRRVCGAQRPRLHTAPNATRVLSRVVWRKKTRSRRRTHVRRRRFFQFKKKKNVFVFGSPGVDRRFADEHARFSATRRGALLRGRRRAPPTSRQDWRGFSRARAPGRTHSRGPFVFVKRP